MNTKYVRYSWIEYTKYQNMMFEEYDFFETNFENAAFENVTFKNCKFDKSKTDHIGLWGCDFLDCVFTKVDLRNAPIGAEGSLIENCRFIKCDFRGQHLWSPIFKNCIFDKCKLRNINFNAAIFKDCKFIGKLEDVTFNGIYDSSMNPLCNVDFSESVFGEFVGFENCDLSTCVPPSGKTFEDILYIVDLNNLKHLSTGTKDRYVIPKK